MLKMGRSKPWPQALEKLTGSQEVDVGALTEYFQPLRDWLVKQRKKIGYAAPGWEEDEWELPSGAPGLVQDLFNMLALLLGFCQVERKRQRIKYS